MMAKKEQPKRFLDRGVGGPTIRMIGDPRLQTGEFTTTSFLGAIDPPKM